MFYWRGQWHKCLFPRVSFSLMSICQMSYVYHNMLGKRARPQCPCRLSSGRHSNQTVSNDMQTTNSIRWQLQGWVYSVHNRRCQCHHTTTDDVLWEHIKHHNEISACKDYSPKRTGRSCLILDFTDWTSYRPSPISLVFLNLGSVAHALTL